MRRIGIVGTMTDGIFGIAMKYMQLAALFGEPVILTPDSPVMNLELLILKGGPDVNPTNYGERPGYCLSNSNPYQEEFDLQKLPAYITKGTPIFGICRGLQALNVHFGGKLEQHIHDHPTNNEGDREALSHYVIGRGEKAKAFGVNSMHHQAIKTLGEGLEVTHIEANEKGETISNVIEGIKHTELPIIGVQWHPEEIMDDYSIGAIESLLKTN